MKITSSIDFYAGGAGNPYRDLLLRVTFNEATTGASFTQDAFWGADPLNPKLFYVRTALPPGNWSWNLAGCTGTTGGRSCASGVTWTPGGGLGLTVSGPPAPGQLYQRGFPTQIANITGSGTTWSPIVYADGVTPVFWAADTAWSAPGFEASGTTAYWNSYVMDRKGKLFNLLLLAPAALAPQASQVFTTSGACTEPVPNDCSLPNLAYWKKLDTLIKTANQNDLAVLIAGVIDPLDKGVNGTYPRMSNAVSFARYLAARLAGFAVLYSPGFDDRVSAGVAGGGTVLQSMNAVGAALRQASPRASITNHLNGGATCADYESFRGSGWMTFFFFHSGHALNVNGVAGSPCSGYLGTETNVNAALRRAWQIPLTLKTSAAQPVMPSYNAEGPYDALANDGFVTPGSSSFDPSYFEKYVDIRYHSREAGFLSALTGALGFSYGNLEIAHWSSPLSYLNRPSAFDITSLYSLFRTRTAGLLPRPEWIANQPATTFGNPPLVNGDTKRMALATDGSSLVLAYVPAHMPGVISAVKISTTTLPTLSCTGWTYKWFHAQDLAPSTAAVHCTGSNPISVDFPAGVECGDPRYQDCDWVLQIQRTAAASSRAQLGSLLAIPQVWSDLSAGGGSSEIVADLGTAKPSSGPLALALVGLKGVFQQSPVLARLPNGFFVAWHADGPDSSLLGIFGRFLDRDGAPLGEALQINTTTPHDQRDPSVDADAQGNLVVVWSSYGQDGELGGIFGRLFDPMGRPASGEFMVNALTAGHQSKPQVAYLPGGRFVAAWQTDPRNGDPGALSFRVFSPGGQPATGEVRIPGSVDAAPTLMDLAAGPTASLQLRWSLVGSGSASLGSQSQAFSFSGLPLGSVVSTP